MYIILILIGITSYNYDHLSYQNLETCLYHKEKIEELLFLSWKPVTVECVKSGINS